MRPSRRRMSNASLVCTDAYEFLESLKPNSVDLIVSSPPYCMGKEYDTSVKIEDFVENHRRLLPLLYRALRA
jgi:adenine-specific DNA-methyltransferase